MLGRRGGIPFAAVALLWATSEPAFGDCQPSNPAPGGTVTCSNSDNDGFTAPANTPVTVNVQTNASVNIGPGGFALDLNSAGNVVTVDGSLNAGVRVTNGGANITNNGNFNGGITITGNAVNVLTLARDRHINGAVNITGAQNTVESDANFNNGLVLNGSVSNTVTNRGQINNTFSITGDGTNTITNSGTINSGVTIVSNAPGTTVLVNTGTINQNISGLGSGNHTIDNAGLVNNNILLGPGNDVVINRASGAVNFNLSDPLRNIVNGVIDQGAGNDDFQMLGGTVNNSVLQGDGNDTATISAGTITQTVNAGAGNDQLLWSGGQIGALDMGTGDDVAILRNLTSTNLQNITIDGGLGFDRLTLDNTVATGVGRFLNWELIALTNSSQLVFNSTLTLGDAVSGTGTLFIDSTSSVLAGGTASEIRPFTAGQMVSVINAGTIDLTNGPIQATDSLTIFGNYLGLNGRLLLHTELGRDGSPSDKLIISGGAATGSTALLITNVGMGARTIGNGILVVDTVNGGTTAADAFRLGAPAVAGPFEYRLFRGSVDASNPQAWYLRSGLSCSLPNAPSPPCAGPTPPDPTPDPGPTPDPTPTPDQPHYRTEVSLYAAIPAMTLLYGRAILDSLHQRIGEEADMRGRSGPQGAWPSGAWARLIGLHGRRDGENIYGNGPKYAYDFLGIQGGQDFYRREWADGIRDYAGLYFALGTARGRVSHFDGSSGRSDFQGYSIGGYWTRFGPSGWYVDAVLQGTWYDVRSTADRGVNPLTTSGVGFAGSLEGGYPFRIGNGFFVEPQAQLVYQKIDLAEAGDVSNTIVRFSNVDSLAGRIGVRLGRTWAFDSGPKARQVTVWFTPNLWHEFRGNPRTEFSSEIGFIPFRADLGGSWLELNTGVSGQIGNGLSVFGNISYQTRFEGVSYAYTGKFGFKKVW